MKRIRQAIIIVSLMLLLAGCAQKAHVPEGFVYVKDVIPSAQQDIRYYGSDNFVGRPIDGYHAPVAILTNDAARALAHVGEELAGQGYGLKIFDAYRPQRAVDDFIRWANDRDDVKMKEEYYPLIDKKELFSQGYIARKSGHSRGSTVDVTLVNKKTGAELDMGSHFDYLDPLSAHVNPLITSEQADNRKLLKTIMEKHGFKSYTREWWHYTLIKEPYPDRYFDFAVDE